MNQRQQNVIEYLREENRVLREQLGDGRLRFTDGQRRRLAVRAKGLGRKLLMEIATLVTPATLLTWLRKLIAQKYDGSARRKPGRPVTKKELAALWFAWQKRITTGVTAGFRVHWPIWDMNVPAHDCRYSAAARHRTCARAEPENNLERVPQAALGTDRSGGLLHKRGLDKQTITRYLVLFFIDLSTRG